MKQLQRRDRCPDCRVWIGECHESGCSVEICPFCGIQMIQDACRYIYFGIDPEHMKFTYSGIYDNNLPEVMDAEYEHYLRPHLLVWDGLWPGDRECHEYEFWCKMTSHGWQTCDKNDFQATEDLNRLFFETRWDKKRRRRVFV